MLGVRSTRHLSHAEILQRRVNLPRQALSDSLVQQFALNSMVIVLVTVLSQSHDAFLPILVRATLHYYFLLFCCSLQHIFGVKKHVPRPFIGAVNGTFYEVFHGDIR